MDFIPYSFMDKVKNSTCKIGEKDNSYSLIEPACDRKYNCTIGTDNEEAKGQSLNNGTLHIFAEFRSHTNSIPEVRVPSWVRIV